MGKVSKELLGASAAKVILSILALGDTYGYNMLQTVKKISSGRVKWNVGAIYPVLRKLEEKEFIHSYWKMEDNVRPRKYYQLLELGKVELERETDEWYLVHFMLTQLWESKEEDQIKTT